MLKHRRIVAAVLALGMASVTSLSFAQQPDQAKVNEARDRYERGLKLYEDGAYDAARIELERAYELAPTYKLLYNIGIVRAQLSDFVGAVKNLERFLAEGGENVPPARRAEVTKLLAELRPRIARVNVTTNVAGSDIFVDDTPVGKAPLSQPIEVNPGKRKISASKSGWIPASKSIDVGGSERANVSLELTEASKTVVINTGTRRVPWIGWVATGALAVGAGAFGYFAIKSSQDLADKRDQENADPDQLESDRKKTKVYSYLADGLGVAAVIAGGISLYLTIKWGKEEGSSTPTDTSKTSKAEPRREIRMAPGLGSFAVQGTF